MYMMDSEDEDEPSPIYPSPDKRHSSRGGFLNKGNSCYVGATLQLLLHVPAFSSWLSDTRFETAAVASILKSLNEEHRQCRIVDPEPLLQVVNKFAPNLRRFAQEDAHEFLVLLLHRLVEECQIPVTPINRIFSSAITQFVTCGDCFSTSSVQNTFPLVTTLDLNGMFEIEESAAYSLQPEDLSDCAKCSKCGSQTKRKLAYVMRPAQYLCFHIPRFTPNDSGIYIKSQSKLLISDLLSYSGHKYKLLGIIVHHGTNRSNGHYSAVCRDETNLWYQFNDSQITPINIFEYLDGSECQENAYITLYEIDKDGVETPNQSLSQLMSESNVHGLQPTKVTRRKLIPDPKEEVIPPKKPRINNMESVEVNQPKEVISSQKPRIDTMESVENQIMSSPGKTTKSVSTQTDPIWSYEAKSRGDQERFKYLTGVTPGEFEVIYKYLGGNDACSKLKYNYDDKTPLKNYNTLKVTLKSRLFLVLLRMRRGLSLVDISELMNISKSHSGAIFYTWVRLMAIAFKRLSKFMLVSAVKQNEKKPQCFKPFKNLKIVIDCAEFQIERSSNMQQQGNCYSDYKHYTSGKVCFAVSCYGGISIVSDVYEGRISDKKLVLDMGLLDQLEKGDVIMADRGFRLEEECLTRGLTLLKPPEMSGGREHLSPKEEVLTKSIACVRIYVEHVIGRVKDWKILQNRVEQLLLPNLPDMIVIASFIHNFSKSYIQ